MNRIREGCARWVNPFSKALHEASLRPEDVMAIVFWSKNYLPLLSHLDELDRRDYRMLFHFTITGLPQALEPRVPGSDRLIECARVLSDRYGSDAVLWRYDPIVISTVTDHDYHLRRFEELCSSLEGITKRCYFSFANIYRKVDRNLKALRAETGIVCHDLPVAERLEIAGALAETAFEHGIQLISCCGDYLVNEKIQKAHCVDAELLHRLYPDRIGRLMKLPTREGCGCCECTDIGAYDTCPHGCVYCYANANAETALRKQREHDPTADVLSPSAQAIEIASNPASSKQPETLKLGL